MFSDTNGNGVQGPREAGVTVFLDQAGTGVPGTVTTTVSATDLPVTIPDVSSVTSTLESTGLVGTIAHLTVTLNITYPNDPDLVITLLTPWGTSILLVDRVGNASNVTDADFKGTVLDDQAALAIGSGAPPFPGSYQPEQPLGPAVNGHNPNGLWQLLVQDVAPYNNGTLDGWSLSITTTEPTATTDADGNYAFTGLPPGTYTVRQVLPSGQLQTTANPAPVTVTAGSSVAGGSFGDTPAQIGGRVFDDLNGDGVQDDGEAGLAGVTVFLDLNHDGTLDPGDPTAITNANGDFAFANLAAGTYVVSQVLPSGWAQSTAAPAAVTVGGADAAGIDFGDYQPGSISGQVFLDSNANAVANPGEPGLSGWTMYLDLNHDGTLDPGDPTAVTNATGNYTFTGLRPGVYTVRQVTQAGWARSTPNPAPVTIGGGAAAAGVSFGDYQAVTVSGQVFTDLNGNGEPDAGEPGLAGVAVSLTRTIATLAAPIAQPVPIPQAVRVAGTVQPGSVTSTLVAGPFAGTITNLTVTLNITDTFDSDLVVVLVTPWGEPITLIAHEGVGQQNFTDTVLEDSATTPISAGVAPFTGSFEPEQPLGTAVDGSNPNGLWQLQVTATNPNSVGTINSWSLSITTAAASTTTDANGDYSFAGLPPGTYHVEQIAPSGYAPTTPNPVTITLSSGGSAVVPLGDMSAQISGRVFADLNGDGVQDDGEAGLAGRTVFLDLFHDGTVDPGDPTAITNANGDFAFANLAAGTYTVDQVLPSGWAQSTAAPAAVTVGGVDAAGVDFGDYQPGSISGQVFNDVAGGAGLSGWTVYLDDNNNGSLQELSATTDTAGNYSFPDLGPGTYTVSLAVPSDWRQTTLNSPSITLTSGSKSGDNFGPSHSSPSAGPCSTTSTVPGSRTAKIRTCPAGR